MKLLVIISLITTVICEKENPTYLAPSLFVNHGGGPMPVIGDEYNREIGESLRNVSNYVDLKRLTAVIVVTAHREENVVTISSAKHHDMVYDYTNYPPQSYKFKHNAPGDPELAKRIHEAFRSEGIRSELDSERGWDHGVFIPMMLINPEANIPVIQVSILKNQNAAQHFEIGKVLHRFRKEGVLILGSGLSYHNMAEFDKAEVVNDGVIDNEAFNQFLTEVGTGSVEERRRILDWESMPGARDSHPVGKADHLMPLIVNLGAAGSQPGRKVFDSVFMSKFRVGGFLWEEE